MARRKDEGEAREAVPKEEKKKRPGDEAEARVRDSIQTRLDMLMSGSSVYAQPRSAQEVADGTGISRAAVRKYMQCRKGGSSAAVPSATALCRIADYFDVTPNYILGYPREGSSGTEETVRKYDSACAISGLSLETIKKLEELKAEAAASPHGAEAAGMLDRVLRAAASELLQELKKGE